MAKTSIRFTFYSSVILIGCLFGCRTSEKHESLAIDKLVFTKGTITSKFDSNIPDSLIGKSPELYTKWNDRQFLKISGRNAVFYFNERYNMYSNKKGYYKAVIDDNTLRTINQYLTDINFDDIYDSALVRADSIAYLHEHFTFLFLLVDKKKTKDVESREMYLCKKDFSNFSGLIDGLNFKLKLEKITDTASIRAEFDSLKYSIIYSRKDVIPRYRGMIKFKIPKKSTRHIGNTY
ncbi:MAG: hypothetical protein ACM3Q2_04135 [Syntrophothermus sp.]